MAASLAWEVVVGRMSFSPVRGSVYAMFVGCCLVSQVLANTVGSIMSMMELFVIYAFMTVTVPVSADAYVRILNNVVKLMIVPALIVLAQYGYQTLSGTDDPISMTTVVPKAFLLQGFVYEAHYPMWNSPFQRPNGFFFLEPSFFSFFSASAAIIELTYFRRPLLAALMVGATILSTASTGLTMLLLAAPFLLTRQSPKLVIPLIVIGVLGLMFALSAGTDHLPLLSRMNELDQQGSSGRTRMIMPLQILVGCLSDPYYLLTGQGAGTTPREMGGWAISKIAYEYGITAMLAFIALFIAGCWGNYNLPLKVAVGIIFNFTGLYLLDSITVQFIALLFCIVVPIREAYHRPNAPVTKGDIRYV